MFEEKSIRRVSFQEHFSLNKPWRPEKLQTLQPYDIWGRKKCVCLFYYSEDFKYFESFSNDQFKYLYNLKGNKNL